MKTFTVKLDEPSEQWLADQAIPENSRKFPIGQNHLNEAAQLRPG